MKLTKIYILIRIGLKCFVNDSETLSNDFEMLCVMMLKGCVNDFEMNLNDVRSCLSNLRERDTPRKRIK